MTKKSTILILSFLFFLCIVPVSAMDLPDSFITLGTGAVLDVAPFGLEQVYPVLTGSLGVKLGPRVSPFLFIHPSLAINEDSGMFRFPLLLGLDLWKNRTSSVRISMYGGAGLDIYRSELHDTTGPLITAGGSVFLGWFYVDAAVSRAYRSYNDDTDIALTAGITLF